jgi:hypothetical protein
LKEQHHEDRLGKFILTSRQEPYEQCSKGGDNHQEVFVEGIPLKYALDSFSDDVISHEQIGNEVDYQQLPYRQIGCLLDDVSSCQQYGRCYNSNQLFVHSLYIISPFFFIRRQNYELVLATKLQT